MQNKLVERLRQSPPVMLRGLSPYMNVANCAYVDLEDLKDAADYIAELESKVAAYEKYLDNGTRLSRSGVPIVIRSPSA